MENVIIVFYVNQLLPIAAAALQYVTQITWKIPEWNILFTIYKYIINLETI